MFYSWFFINEPVYSANHGLGPQNHWIFIGQMPFTIYPNINDKALRISIERKKSETHLGMPYLRNRTRVQITFLQCRYLTKQRCKKYSDDILILLLMASNTAHITTNLHHNNMSHVSSLTGYSFNTHIATPFSLLFLVCVISRHSKISYRYNFLNYFSLTCFILLWSEMSHFPRHCYIRHGSVVQTRFLVLTDDKVLSKSLYLFSGGLVQTFN